jgi:predicted O-linked N-acetylglucosamine transferase (SPINDLY family)
VASSPPQSSFGERALRAYAAGSTAKAAGRLDEAIAEYRRAVRFHPARAEFHVSLGIALRAAGRREEAREAYERAVAIAPALAEAHHNLGNLHAERGDWEAARGCYLRALAASPYFTEAHYELGNVLRETGAVLDAVACYERALALKPGFAAGWRALGMARQELREHAAALAAYERALELAPDSAATHVNLSTVNRQLSRVERAMFHARRAVELDSRAGAAHNNLGTLHLDIGEHAQAEASYRRALETQPENAQWRSNLCMLATYSSRRGPRESLAVHREYGQLHPMPPRRPFANRKDPERRLRVGYVSPDLRRHAVAHFAEPLLARHDRSAFEVFGYYTHRVGDEVTLRLREYFDQWIEAPLMSADELAERVRADGVDLLVDLSGHTAGNRLTTFARKPAPVQLTWLGYVTTTGLPAMDCRITDRWIDPPGHEAFSSERLLRLDGCALCYRPPAESPEVAPLPALARGHVTFGSFNGIVKLSEHCIAVWAMLLAAVPRARLLLKSSTLDDPFVRERVLARFASAGVEAARLELRGGQPETRAHLAQYAEVDIALDTLPFNGVTTTCEALWMGVPVITLPGATHASRQGLTLLSAVGLPELAAPGERAFARIGAMLAADLDRLAVLRTGLRGRLTASPLMREEAFARRMEAAYRSAWRRCCEEGGRAAELALEV